ncbi:Pimeloyl-ACP methyl ester carboxylesterase [Saccharopolyspora kobensis]|uniref:Pimeloyl-ACP methyl ester carboxylesterase n=1 Tax=Saccharopolyspora kobensis TaxID=146035 RepID=A0A1H5WJN2_9PSEU|nr:alpha/beta hydrolase [Saccharopolyspora kobensis]SEF99496.1 Pimeloyl-ACP methyl ester carboxylesterase [Saccharopolyspora kobensis]SFD76316.1 Pimeloyl-ACP methyl ester carboxylesterase [Saccharopolyspora kobensis]
MTTDVFAEHQDVELAQGPLRVYQAGPEGAPCVVLLHGAMLDTAELTWRHLMPVLARDRRVVAVDLPRHGGSRPWAGVLDQARMERVVEELLDHLGVSRAVLVGLSMGGGIGIGYALARPERVAGLVAINPGGLDDKRPLQWLTWLSLQCSPLLRWSARWVASPSVLRRSMVRTFVRGEGTRDFEALMELIGAEARRRSEHGERALDDWQIAAYGPRRMRLNHLPELPRLRVPSLWVHGREDTLVSRAVMRRAVESAPGAVLAEIGGAGHLAPLDQPDAVAEAVVSFLDRLG